MSSPAPKTAILCSGGGSNMEAVVKACKNKDLDLNIELVISNKPEAACLIKAHNLGIQTQVLPNKESERNDTLLKILSDRGIELVLLAGFLKKLSSELVSQFSNRILNIHPSLLPKYGGPGMYGLRVHQAVYNAKEEESGATVHIVTEEFDQGPIILQSKTQLDPSDSPEIIAKKVLVLEHKLYTEAINKYLKEIYPNVQHPSS